MVHCSRRMHESLTSGGAMSVVLHRNWPCSQLANSNTSMHIGTRLRHNVCICFCIRAALSHWQTHNNWHLTTLQKIDFIYENFIHANMQKNHNQSSNHVSILQLHTTYYHLLLYQGRVLWSLLFVCEQDNSWMRLWMLTTYSRHEQGVTL